MQQIVLETPYRFIPPTRGRIWPAILARLIAPYLRRFYGITSYEVRGAKKVRASLDAGCGILCAGNHSRACEPLAAGWLTLAARHPFFCMASWHTFMGSKIEAFLIRRCGAYSIYREGTDHASLTFTVDALASAERPVMIFSEGAVTRTNDRVRPFLEGTSTIARLAARRAAKATPPRRVVIHPVAFKYFYGGNVETALPRVIEPLEKQLNLSPAKGQVIDRVRRLEDALLARHETRHFGAPLDNGMSEGQRAAHLVQHLLAPIEAEWSPKQMPKGGNFARVQVLRSRILPDIVAGRLTADELQRRRQQLADLYWAQMLNNHPLDFLENDTSPERIIEAVERIEEDLTDRTTPFPPTHLVIEAGDAIEVEPTRQRGEEDPLSGLVRARITEILHGIEGPTM